VKEILCGWVMASFIYIIVHANDSSKVIMTAILGLTGIIMLLILFLREK